jgi:hypothetical protein
MAPACARLSMSTSAPQLWHQLRGEEPLQRVIDTRSLSMVIRVIFFPANVYLVWLTLRRKRDTVPFFGLQVLFRALKRGHLPLRGS